MDFLFGLGIFLVIILVMAGLAIRRALEFKKLAQEGSMGTAIIIGKKRGQKGRTLLQYEFRAPTGEVIKKNSLVSEKVFSECAVGQKLEVFYLLENPKIIAPKYLVDEAKKTLSDKGIGSI